MINATELIEPALRLAKRHALSPIEAAERALLPDAVIRIGIRALCTERLRHERRGGSEATHARFRELLAGLRGGPIAVHTDAANQQHYELPPRFFELVLGPHRKYSSCYFPEGVTTLAAAEEAMLRETVEFAGIRDGERVLELGFGWGSLTLFMAARFPNARFTCVSNSAPQRLYVTEKLRALGLTNVTLLTADVNTLDLPAGEFDRCVSVEMLEHVRNHQAVFARIACWLRPGGGACFHVFCHRELAYPFEPEGEGDFMARHFFTGGIMPSADLFARFQQDLVLEDERRFSGTHYAKTAEAWLARHDAARTEIRALFEGVYGKDAALWDQRWRIFFLSCAELFGYDQGNEWMVVHQRFTRR